MARSTNILMALDRAWQSITPQVHSDLRRQYLTSDDVKRAVRAELDTQTRANAATHKYWATLPDEQKQDALDRAFTSDCYWLIDGDGEPVQKPDGWE